MSALGNAGRIVAVAGLGATLALAAASCGPDEDVPFAPRSIRVDVRDPFGVRPPGELQVALLWTTSSTIWASRPAVMPAGVDTIELPLAFPEPVPTNIFFQPFPLVRIQIPVAVPRIAVYVDEDDSGDFTPWPLDDGPPADRIVALNTVGTTVVLAVDAFEQTLDSMTTVDVNRYYELTDGLHTPFLIFAGETSTLTPAGLAESGPPLLSMFFEDAPSLARDVRCVSTANFIDPPQLIPIAAAGTSSRTEQIEVDDRIDLEAVCGLDTPVCTSTNTRTATVTVPMEVLTPGRRVFAQCRQGSLFESYVTLEAELQCDECSCQWVERQRALIVRTSSTPDWWPCGNAVDFCPSPLPLYRADETCALEEEEMEENDGDMGG